MSLPVLDSVGEYFSEEIRCHHSSKAYVVECFAPSPPFAESSGTPTQPLGLLCNQDPGSGASSLIDVFLAWRLVLADKVLGDMFAEPSGELHQLLTQPVHRLLVHIGLRNKLRQRNCSLLADIPAAIRIRWDSTEQTSEMLSTVRVASTLVSAVRSLGPLLMKLLILCTLESRTRLA